MHAALLLAVALQLEPSAPRPGEAATLIVETRGETAPLRVDIGGAAMLRRVPEGATVERAESDLHLQWQRPPAQTRVELVLRADASADWLNVTATSGTSKATLGVKPLAREPVPESAQRTILLALGGAMLSLLLWPTFRLLWRNSRLVGLLAVIGGTVMSVFFVRMWWRDYETTRDYRQGTCTVTDRMLVYRGSQRLRRHYSLMYAVELDGRPRINGDGDRSGWQERDSNAGRKLQQFAIGQTYPCWWSATDLHEVVLEPRRRAITRTLVLTMAAFLIAMTPGWMHPDGRRRRRRR